MGFRVSGSGIGVWGLGFRDRAITANTSTQSSRSALWVRERRNLRVWGVGRWVFARALGCLMVDGFWRCFGVCCWLVAVCCVLRNKTRAQTRDPKGIVGKRIVLTDCVGVPEPSTGVAVEEKCLYEDDPSSRSLVWCCVEMLVCCCWITAGVQRSAASKGSVRAGSGAYTMTFGDPVRRWTCKNTS